MGIAACCVGGRTVWVKRAVSAFGVVGLVEQIVAIDDGSSVSIYLSQRCRARGIVASGLDCRRVWGAVEASVRQAAWPGYNGLLVGEADVGWPCGRPEGSIGGGLGGSETHRRPLMHGVHANAATVWAHKSWAGCGKVMCLHHPNPGFPR